MNPLAPVKPLATKPLKRAQQSEKAKELQRTLRTRGAQKLYGK